MNNSSSAGDRDIGADSISAGGHDPPTNHGLSTCLLEKLKTDLRGAAQGRSARGQLKMVGLVYTAANKSQIYTSSVYVSFCTLIGFIMVALLLRQKVSKSAGTSMNPRIEPAPTIRRGSRADKK